VVEIPPETTEDRMVAMFERALEVHLRDGHAGEALDELLDEHQCRVADLQAEGLAFGRATVTAYQGLLKAMRQAVARSTLPYGYLRAFALGMEACIEQASAAALAHPAAHLVLTRQEAEVVRSLFERPRSA
jgi:hypothetical protein